MSGLAALAVVASVVVPGTANAAAAPAVPLEVADAAATLLPESTQAEKVKAVRAIEVGDVTDDWLILSDKNFVFKVYDQINADKYPLTRAEAYRVYRIMVTDDAAPDATAFIRTGIFGFVDRDHIEYARRQEEARQAREARQKAAAFAEIPADAAMLDGSDQNFVYEVWHRATGPKVKDGAAAAWGGDATTWKTFITTTIYQLHREDQADAVEKARQESEEKAKQLAAQQAKKNAVAVVGIVAPEGWLVLSDENLIRQLLASAEVIDARRLEVHNAAEAALRSSNPADWKAFIDTGIYEADKRDAAREQTAREEAARQRVREIAAKAENGRLQPRLVAAANAALAAGPSEVTRFLSDIQYTVLDQSLMAATPGVKGWYVRSGGGDAWITPGTSHLTDPVVGVALGASTWKVVTGLADPACFSFESAEHVGSYLRQQDYRVRLAASDGSDQYKTDATWCSRPGLSGSGVSLESKALPGRFLRYLDAKLWAANDSGQFQWDNPGTFKENATFTAVDPDPLITTSIMLRWYNDDGWRSAMGNPTAGEVADGTVHYRDFSGGRAYSNFSSVYSVSGPVLAKYLAVGGHKLQMPTTDTTVTPDGTGSYNHLVGGMSIYWSPSTGAHLILGAIREHWESLGWEKSYLGYPTSDELQAGDLRRSTFQHGNIDHDPATGRTWDYHVG